MHLRTRFSSSVFALVFAATAIAANTGFDGKWVVDKSKTQSVGAPEDLQVEMKQDGSKLMIRSKYREPKTAIYPLLWVGIMTYDLELTTDGTEKVNQIGPFAHNS